MKKIVRNVFLAEMEIHKIDPRSLLRCRAVAHSYSTFEDVKPRKKLTNLLLS
jgi:hypothetical protein